MVNSVPLGCHHFLSHAQSSRLSFILVTEYMFFLVEEMISRQSVVRIVHGNYENVEEELDGEPGVELSEQDQVDVGSGGETTIAHAREPNISEDLSVLTRRN
jgi:hypothetical protein